MTMSTMSRDSKEGNIEVLIKDETSGEDILSQNDDYELTSNSNVFKRFAKTFERKQKKGLDGDLEDNNELDQVIKPYHTVMITLGTGIGTGLLVGTGSVLSQSGPLGLIIGYVVSSFMVYLVLQSAGELGIVYSNVVGNFSRYASLLIGPGFGFAISIIYTFQWLTVFPLQLVTSAMVIDWWKPGVNLDLFVFFVYIFVVAINLCGARGYVEAEFAFNICKILMMIGFIILGIVIITGGAGSTGYIGGKYWNNPGLFAHGFKGVATVFCFAAFSYGGVETVILTAAEQENPMKSIPRATKVVVFRILLIYLFSLIIVCFLVPYNNSMLMGSGGVSSSSSSPFVIAVELHGIKVVPHLINAVILISVISVANSALYATPRLLLSLAQEGIIPHWFEYIDNMGRPLYCMLLVCAVGCLGFIATSDAREEMFIWLLSIGGLGQIYIWMSICLCHIRFRYVLKAQNIDINDTTFYKSQTGVIGSVVALLIALFVLVCQFWVALFPVGGDGHADVKNFFENYLAFPVVLAAYVGYKVYHKDWRLIIKSEDVLLPDTIFN